LQSHLPHISPGQKVSILIVCSLIIVMGSSQSDAHADRYAANWPDELEPQYADRWERFRPPHAGEARYHRFPDRQGIMNSNLHDVELCRQEAEAGVAQAQSEYAYRLEFGRGVSVDLRQAADYYKRSADQGNPRGECGYGRCLEFGKGVEVDMHQAAEYYQKSADQGYVRGQYYYARCCFNGTGVDIDREIAAKYFEKSANGGLSDGMYMWANCLADGEGVARNMKLAQEWYAHAADNGHSTARVIRDVFRDDARLG
jgi:TPR repeat protein